MLGRATVYLTLCYREVLADPMRPMLANGCDPAPGCEHGRVVESYQVCASTTPPDAGPDCEPCCGACGDPCLLLATVRDFDPTQPLRQEQVDLAGRRSLALHPFATITGINWVHGGTYSRQDVNTLLDRGLRFTLSRGVRVDTLRAGVVELTGIESGGGRSARSTTSRASSTGFRPTGSSRSSPTGARPTRRCSSATGCW